MEQAKIQGSAAKQAQNTADIIKVEIKLSRGGNTERKEAEVAELEAKSQETTASQMSTLAEAEQIMSEAAKAENKNNSHDKNDKETDKPDSKSTENNVTEDATNTKTYNISSTQGERTREDSAADSVNTPENSDNTQQNKKSQPTGVYPNIDVRI